MAPPDKEAAPISVTPAPPASGREEEHSGSIWTHPYLAYILCTLVLFLLLLLIGWIAWTQGWVPNRGSINGGGGLESR
jgi:hypothetical protein